MKEQKEITPHPLLKQLVEDINTKLDTHFKYGIQNYGDCWQAEKVHPTYNEHHKITMYIPVQPSYAPRKMHQPFLTFVLATDRVLIKFHITMSVGRIEEILTLVKEVERKWIEETS